MQTRISKELTKSEIRELIKKDEFKRIEENCPELLTIKEKNMNTRTLVTLSEEDVDEAIKEYVKTKTGLEVKDISYDIHLIGNFDNDEHFTDKETKKVTCECDVKIK
jgi:hypothetical protein